MEEGEGGAYPKRRRLSRDIPRIGYYGGKKKKKKKSSPKQLRETAQQAAKQRGFPLGGKFGDPDSPRVIAVSGAPPTGTAFIYRTQEDYRHVHVHPKPYRAYRITRIEIRFVSSHLTETSDRRRAQRFAPSGKTTGRRTGSAATRTRVLLPSRVSFRSPFSILSFAFSFPLAHIRSRLIHNRARIIVSARKHHNQRA